MSGQAGRLLKILNEEEGFDLSLKGLASFMQIEWREGQEQGSGEETLALGTERWSSQAEGGPRGWGVGAAICGLGPGWGEETFILSCGCCRTFAGYLLFPR